MKSKRKSNNFLSPKFDDKLKWMGQWRKKITTLERSEKCSSKKIRKPLKRRLLRLCITPAIQSLFTCFLTTTAMAPFKNCEKLSRLLKMHPCLYSRQEKKFKKKKVKQRAWQEIARQLNLEQGKIVEHTGTTWRSFFQREGWD